MSSAFVAQLRTSGALLRVGEHAGVRVSLKVAMPEVWDVVLLDAASAASVAEVKEAALGRLYPGYLSASDFVMKLNGFEVLDERNTVKEAGARDGSTFLLTFRRRRPVR